MKLFIKNMTTVDSRKSVETLLVQLGFHVVKSDTGEIQIRETLSSQKYNALKKVLLRCHFEVISDGESQLIEKIKHVIIEMIHLSDELPITKYSDYISKKLKVNYTYVSKVFSKFRHTTIEHFIIEHKIERVKHLLVHNGLTLSEIALRLNYSSTAHLSSQFKKITGLTPSVFKKKQNEERK